MENANQRDPNDPVIRYKDYDRTAGGVGSTPLLSRMVSHEAGRPVRLVSPYDIRDSRASPGRRRAPDTGWQHQGLVLKPVEALLVPMKHGSEKPSISQSCCNPSLNYTVR